MGTQRNMHGWGWVDGRMVAGQRRPLRTDPARSTSVSDDLFRSPLGFSALGCTVLTIFTTKREWLRELASFIFVVAIERCSLPAQAGDETKTNENVIPQLSDST
jgi:hypothetical protein